MMIAAHGSKVKVHYTGTYDHGEVFDSSSEGCPLEFEVGAGQVIPGFEKAVIGMSVGDSKKVRIPEEEAYGPYNPEMMFETDPSQFEEGLAPEAGQQFQTELEDGTPLLLTVMTVTEDKIVMNANHPMAGKTLNFAIEMVEIN
ncbi:MAG: peptidylprolyl isomerase [Desulfuromonadaceae bacterium]|nr:peptidylprolyl isomerase [Desulfuromonadaceae bacterium]